MNSKIDDYVEYLSAWCKIADGKYRPYDLRGIEKELAILVSLGNTKPIETFKEKFLNNEISFPIFCIGLSPEYEKKCYEECLKTISEFESSHNNL